VSFLKKKSDQPGNSLNFNSTSMDTEKIPDEANKDNLDIQKLIFENVYDGLNRCRDWPLKIIGFTSGLYIAVLGALKLFSKDGAPISYNSKWFIIVGISMFCIYCIIILGKQHLQYLDCRKTQIRLEKKWGINEWTVDDEKIMPPKWFNPISRNLLKKGLGWIFYALYISFLSAFSIYLIFNL